MPRPMTHRCGSSSNTLCRLCRARHSASMASPGRHCHHHPSTTPRRSKSLPERDAWRPAWRCHSTGMVPPSSSSYSVRSATARLLLVLLLLRLLLLLLLRARSTQRRIARGCAPWLPKPRRPSGKASSQRGMRKPTNSHCRPCSETPSCYAQGVAAPEPKRPRHSNPKVLCNTTFKDAYKRMAATRLMGDKVQSYRSHCRLQHRTRRTIRRVEG